MVTGGGRKMILGESIIFVLQMIALVILIGIFFTLAGFVGVLLECVVNMLVAGAKVIIGFNKDVVNEKKGKNSDV